MTSIGASLLVALTITPVLCMVLLGRQREGVETASLPGLSVAVGQPISHRIEHMVSGVLANLAVKIFGADLDQLRRLAKRSEAVLETIPGLVDITVEQQTEIPQVVIRPKTAELAAFGTTPGELARFVELAFVGKAVAWWWEEERAYDVVARLPEPYRSDLELLASTPVDVDGKRYAELRSIARIDKTTGPNLINRENVQRRIVVTANVTGRDLRGAAREIQAEIACRGRQAGGLSRRARRRIRE